MKTKLLVSSTVKTLNWYNPSRGNPLSLNRTKLFFGTKITSVLLIWFFDLSLVAYYLLVTKVSIFRGEKLTTCRGCSMRSDGRDASTTHDTLNRSEDHQLSFAEIWTPKAHRKLSRRSLKVEHVVQFRVIFFRFCRIICKIDTLIVNIWINSKGSMWKWPST